VIVRAPAKLNLCLHVGPRRGDGLHQLASLFCPLTLADRMVVTEAQADEVVCKGVEGPNLAETALGALRQRGWDHPPLRIEIEKRIPVAAGLAGGSADAAAVLRLAAGDVADLDSLAFQLGADVPSQLEPSFALVRGAGETIEHLPAPAEFAVVLVPAERGLATADVFAEADRMGVSRDAGELESIAGRLREAAGSGASPLTYTELLANDLMRPALSLRPEIAEALAALEVAGAARALITGSGPTAFGLFADIVAADRAAAELPPRFAGAIVAACTAGVAG
jgi:4-diphosphocytidyl-2-C-methyl-D-erythritol kinase